MASSFQILVIGEGISLAHVTRALLVARVLIRRGHQVVFATADRYRHWVERQGLAVQPVYTPEAQAVYARLRRMQPMYTADELQRSVEADLALMDAVAPDIVLGDCRNSLRISTELAAVPYAAMMNANCTPWFAGVMRVPAAFPLNRVFGKQRVDRYLTPIVGRPVRALACRYLAGPFAAVQKRMGARRYCRDFRLMFTSDDLNLIADLPQLMPSRRLPGHCHYVGPLFWKDDPQHSGATHDLLAQIDPDCPLIYLTMGSTGSGSILEAIKPALAQMACRFVVTVGHQAGGGDWPANMYPIPFASAPAVLQRAAAVICHGGSGTIYQALSAGVPIIAVPSFFDQETQSDQIVAAGLGLRVDEADAATCLVQAVQRILDEPGFRGRAELLGRSVRRGHADQAAADILETYLADRQGEQRAA